MSVDASSAASGYGFVSRIVRRVGGGLKSGLALVGFASVAGLYAEYQRLNPTIEGNEKGERKVLVIPFDRMNFVERKVPNFRSSFARLQREDDTDTRTFAMEVRELVDILHHAASDPSITAVYGVFGGSGVTQAGWAQLEEIRNALQVIKESHRRHHEPNLTHSMQVIPRIQSKPLYAFAESFASTQDSSNKDYYLASIFTHIHMQEKGELNLFGMMMQQYFLRDLLENYGIQLHVFKHGIYKNAPNTFTHSGMNKFHREQVEKLHTALNDAVCDDITRSRYKALLTSWLTKQHRTDKTPELWRKIHDSGTFPAETAWKAGLVDYLPRCDPLEDLVDSNEDFDEASETHEKKDTIAAKWNVQETDFKRFPANAQISLQKYAVQINKEKNAVKRRSQWLAYAETVGPLAQQLFSTIGFEDEKKTHKKESIALLQIDGMIGDDEARRVISSIRKIRKDIKTKCVVVRVSSPGGSIVACENVLQELKRLSVPVVVSFGDVSASGGYYISSAANRIFSSKKTITGSIGVFGIRMDLTGLAEKYGINVQHVAAGDLSASYNAFAPMSSKMKQNMASQIDRCYDQFKSVVSEGRNIPLADLERIAQGCVFTGDEAKSNGLVDELGGLHRAIAYARRSFTEGVDDADIVLWPKKPSIFERLMDATDKSNIAERITGLFYDAYICDQDTYKVFEGIGQTPATSVGIYEWMLKSPSGFPGALSGILLTVDENTAIQCLLKTNGREQGRVESLLPESFWQ